MGVTSPKAWPIGFIDTLTPNTGMVLFIIDHKKASNKTCFFPPFKIVRLYATQHPPVHHHPLETHYDSVVDVHPQLS
jgi:hypothetical protein